MHSVLPEKVKNMGVHRFYDTKNLRKWCNRVQNISEETKKPFEKKMDSLRKHMNFLEEQAINRTGARGEFMQTVIHRGVWKYKPQDFN
jgi:hypothetical protein